MKKFLLIAVLFTAFVTSTTFAETPQTTKSTSAVVAITNDNFQGAAAHNEFLVVDFWAPWCGPCRAIAPALEELAAEYFGRVVVGKCNVDDNRALAQQFNIRSIPAIFFIKNGKVVDQQIGSCGKDVLKAKIENMMK